MMHHIPDEQQPQGCLYIPSPHLLEPGILPRSCFLPPVSIYLPHLSPPNCPYPGRVCYCPYYIIIAYSTPPFLQLPPGMFCGQLISLCLRKSYHKCTCLVK